MYEYRDLLLMRELMLSLMLGLFVLSVVLIESWRRRNSKRTPRHLINPDAHRAVLRSSLHKS